MTVYKSGISAAFFLWFFVIDGLLLQCKALKGSLQLLLPLENLGHQLVEGTSGTLECFGAGLKVNDANLVSHSGRLAPLHLPLIIEVIFVTNEQEVDFGDIGLLIDLLDPKVDHFEGLMIGDIEDEEDAIHVAVVVGRDGVVARGACSVPDLHSDGVAVLQLEDLLLVLHPDGRGVVHVELLVHVLRQQ